MNRLWLLALAFALVLSLGIVFACGDDDDDNDDNDTSDDDSVVDDDTVVELTCQEAYDLLYVECSLGFFDDDDVLIAEEDVVASCEAGETFYAVDAYACITENQDDCDAIAACLGTLV